MKNINEDLKAAELPKAIQEAISNRELMEVDEEKKASILLAAKNNPSTPGEIITVRPPPKQRSFHISPVWMYAAALLIFFALSVLVKQTKTPDNTIPVQQKRMTQAERTELAKMLLIDNRLKQTRMRTVAMRSSENNFPRTKRLDTKLNQARLRSNRLNRNSQLKEFPDNQLKQKSLKLNYHKQSTEDNAQEA